MANTDRPFHRTETLPAYGPRHAADQTRAGAADDQLRRRHRQRRRERGLKLNHPEAVAITTAFVLEGARDGRTVADLMSAGRSVLAREDVMQGVPEMIESVQVEATFPDGTKLVTVHGPIA